MYLGNEFSVDVMIHAWERKFVYCSVETFSALRFEAEDIPLVYTRV